MTLLEPKRSLVALGEGVYTVPETCRILRPSMTPRKVHYWLNTGLLGDALRRGEPGTPTLLSFEQVLKVRALQRLRDVCGFSLQRVRRDLERFIDDLTSPNWHSMEFIRTGHGDIGYIARNGEAVALGGQGVMDDAIPGLTEFITIVRREWDERRLNIDGFEHLVSDAAVLAGSPIIVGTRVETAFIANLAEELTLAEVRMLFPEVDPSAISQAADFEGVTLRAA
jgi:uncharacterized protein (DUF433 family)